MAKKEFDRAFAHYEDQRQGLGVEFDDEVHEALRRIHENPYVGASIDGQRHRFVLVRRFPYVIYYTQRADTIWMPSRTRVAVRVIGDGAALNEVETA